MSALPDSDHKLGVAFSTSIAVFGLQITVMSGYLIVAYMVGERLTRIQVLIINTFYLLSASTLVLSAFQGILDVSMARREAALQIPELPIVGASTNIFIWPASIALMNAAVVIASVYFMWSVRHSKSEILIPKLEKE
jgi:hypothetical protein